MFIIKKIKYNAPVVLTFSLLSLAALLAGIWTEGYSNGLLFSVYRSPPTDMFTYFRIFGHVLGHANFEHYFNNFLLVLLVGPMLEEKYGSKNLSIMILFTALVTGLLNIIFFSSALLGASGIVFMMILLSSYANYEKGKIPLTLILVIIAFIGKEVIEGLYSHDNISQITHIVGGACGGIFGFVFNKKKKEQDGDICKIKNK